jgi:hypothetical protein
VQIPRGDRRIGVRASRRPVIAGVLGVSGSGKSGCVAMLALDCAETGSRVRFSDHCHTFPGKIFRSVAGYRSAVEQTRELPPLATFRPEGLFADQELFDSVVRLCDEGDVDGKGGCVLVVDEFPDYDLPRDPENPAKVDPRSSFGRVLLKPYKAPAVGMIWAAQSASVVHLQVRKNTRIFYVHQQAEKNDLDYIRHSMGAGGAMIVDEVRSLQPKECFVVDRFSAERPIKVRFDVPPVVYACRAYG